jgi:hypothetical protein
MFLLFRFHETHIAFLQRLIQDRDCTLQQDESRKVSWPRLGILTIEPRVRTGDLCSPTE